jgi:hypothetical protein
VYRKIPAPASRPPNDAFCRWHLEVARTLLLGDLNRLERVAKCGYEFMYPTDQARRLAQGAGQPVPTTQAHTTATASN